VKDRVLILAPHIVYVRHGEHRLAANVVGASQGSSKRARIESFRLADIQDIQVLERSFTPEASFDPDAHEYGDEVVCSISSL
jgi:hypothetical protein